MPVAFAAGVVVPAVAVVVAAVLTGPAVVSAPSRVAVPGPSAPTGTWQTNPPLTAVVAPASGTPAQSATDAVVGEPGGARSADPRRSGRGGATQPHNQTASATPSAPCGPGSAAGPDSRCTSATTTPAAPAGATAVCRDGTYSTQRHRGWTCFGHGGVARWL